VKNETSIAEKFSSVLRALFAVDLNNTREFIPEHKGAQEH